MSITTQCDIIEQEFDSRLLEIGMKKIELIILAVIFLIAFIAIAFVGAIKTGEKNSDEDYKLVEIVSDGEILYSLPLECDESIHIEYFDEFNDIIIKNGAVCVENADCNDLTCVHRGWISEVGDIIVCLPHRLTIQIADSAGR